MNTSPSRQPAFIAIACLSLFAAWSTPEAEVIGDKPRVDALALGEALPPTVRTPPRLEADCLTHAGAQRALCVFAATRHVDPTPFVTARERMVLTPPAVRVAATHNATAANATPKRTFLEERTRSERSLLIR